MYTKNWRNRQSNDQGRLFENLIDQACLYYKNKDIAMIEKTPEPFRVKKINSDGTMTVYPTGKAQPDYKGTLANGQAIVFEAKMTTKDRINKKVITDHQAICLDIHSELGAVTGVCCMIKKTVGFIPWSDWQNMKARYGRQYILEEELSEYQVATPGYIDFLNKSAW
ncbi:Holliday junction resolvase RecU [Enterococcus sp. DIV0876]|uniref:Holliday junction resolvase RecU n=1 Tax=Enterococcus sp. DIV0876 TaxID=2774633 RepID=UPI003D2FE6C1